MSTYDLQDFQTDVIEACQTTPIVVDFWAEWCGPCRMLSPVLESLASRAKGRWKLVKINTEEHPQIAGQFGIRSIPAVKMVFQGKIIAEFTGALPEHAIQQWLDKHLPKSEEEEQDENEINELIERGDRKAIRKYLEKRAQENSSDKDLLVKLALHYLPDQLEDAGKLIAAVKEEPKFELEVQAVDVTRHLSTMNGNGIPEAKSPKISEKYAAGVKALFKEDFEQALEAFLFVMSVDREYDEDGARKACLAIFSMLGEAHPVTKKFRRRFSMALY